MTETSSKPFRGLTPEEKVQESNLVKHAMRELRLAGEEPQTVQGYLDMIGIFADMGHSGGSAPFFVHTLMKLLSFENLLPLTNDPDEWEHIAEAQAGQPDLWQNTRDGKAFSNDGGKTYQVLGELDDNGEQFTFTAQEA